MRQPHLILSSFLAILLMTSHVQAAPAAEVWPFWATSNSNSTVTVDHQSWNRFLKSHVREDDTSGFYLVDYAAVTPQQRDQLNNYVKTVTSLDPRQLNRNEQFAYWVNLYNALTVRLILDNYPVETIRSIGGLFSFGPWDKKIVTVAGKQLTLNDIEHRILRPIWKDARIHYAVNCASMGCPDLLPQAWSAENHQQLLEQAAHRFINQTKGVQVKDKGLLLSKIYSWYGDDFGNKADLLAHLRQYAEPRLKQQLKAVPADYKTSFQYDWNLNRTPGSGDGRF